MLPNFLSQVQLFLDTHWLETFSSPVGLRITPRPPGLH
jgi:hypothetical protein